jgi:hypothetical protein
MIALMFMNARVYVIVNAGLKKVKVTVRHVLLATLGCAFTMILYMILSNIFSPQDVKQYTTMAVTGQYTMYNYCEARSVGVDAVLYAFEGAVLVVNLVFSYQTRMVPGIINKSEQVGKLIATILLVAAIVIILDFGFSFDPWVDSLITGLAFFVCCLTLFYRYFAATAYYLIGGYDLDRNLNVVKRSVLISMRVAMTDDTAAGVVKTPRGATAATTIFASDDQRKVVGKYMQEVSPKTIGECNELISFLRDHIAELAMNAIRFSSDGSSGTAGSAGGSAVGSASGGDALNHSRRTSSAVLDGAISAGEIRRMHRHSLEGKEALEEMTV